MWQSKPKKLKQCGDKEKTENHFFKKLQQKTNNVRKCYWHSQIGKQNMQAQENNTAKNIND